MKLDENNCKILHRNIREGECECEANKRRKELIKQNKEMDKDINRLTDSKNICYICFLQRRIDENEKGCGLGRIQKSVDWKDGIYKLFLISSIHKDLRDGAQRQAGVADPVDYLN